MTQAGEPQPTINAAPSAPGSAQSRPEWRSSAVAFVVMCLAVIAVYVLLPSHSGDNTQGGGDYNFLHSRRIAFGIEHLSEHGSLPGWYSHEMMGSPYWANIQNFPFIPSRLAVLLVPDLQRYTVGVMLNALLAATFTFAFARALRVSPIAAAAAGWTFACAGFYASRVLVGALPLLEAYPALPLLLWLVELNAGPRTGRSTRPRVALGGLALASCCVALAGHPQLGLYAFVVAGCYLVVRAWPSPRRMVVPATAMALGVACAAFILVPTASLIGRSTRTLPLERESNNIPLPYSRIGAIVMPWKDGRLADERPAGGRYFPQFPDDAYFNDTVTYVGLLPLAASLGLVGWALWRREQPGRVAVFLAGAGIVAFVTALPFLHSKAGDVASTLVRSPARQTYVTTFVLAMALGTTVHLALRAVTQARPDPIAPKRSPMGIVTLVVVGVLLLIHVIDLARHDRVFVRTTYTPDPARSAGIEADLRKAIGNERIAIDFDLKAPFNRRIDDVGFFDSILLAKPYATILALNKTRPTYNSQRINGSQMSPRTLATLGAKFVMTPHPRRDLPQVGRAGDVPLYEVPNPLPRAMFLPERAAVWVKSSEMRQRMRDGRFEPRSQIMLAGEHKGGATPSATPATTVPTTQANAEATLAQYERPGSDEIVVDVNNAEPGYLRVLESFDPGWRAELNSRPVDVLPADDTFLAVALPAGKNHVRFTYHTPGATMGLLISLASLVTLGVFLAMAGRRPV